MADKRELRVEYCPEHRDEEGTAVEGVWLECDGERVGPFEPWMVEQIRVWVNILHEDDDSMLANDVEEIATALERVLQEAQDGE